MDAGGQHNTNDLNGDLPNELLGLLNSVPKGTSKMVQEKWSALKPLTIHLLQTDLPPSTDFQSFRESANAPNMWGQADLIQNTCITGIGRHIEN